MLELQAGYAFDDDGAIRHQPLHVTVDGVHGIVLGDILKVGLTDAQGVFTESLGIDADALSEGVELHIDTCLAAPSSSSHLRKVCQPAFVIRGLQVEPASASVGAGGTRQFAATFSGLPAQQVTWSVTGNGNQISPTGLFTAGNTNGTFTVRVTSTVSPSVSATATVTVTGGGGGGGGGGGDAGNDPLTISGCGTDKSLHPAGGPSGPYDQPQPVRDRREREGRRARQVGGCGHVGPCRRLHQMLVRGSPPARRELQGRSTDRADSRRGGLSAGRCVHAARDVRERGCDAPLHHPRTVITVRGQRGIERSNILAARKRAPLRTRDETDYLKKPVP
jgi:hypothetical protein